RYDRRAICACEEGWQAARPTAPAHGRGDRRDRSDGSRRRPAHRPHAEVRADLRIDTTQTPLSPGPILPDHHRRQVLNALGISSPSLHVDCPLQILAKGGTGLVIGLQSAELLGSVKPDFEELARLTSHVGAEGYFVFALVEANGVVGTESRMFVPALGISEDPVSGNAHGMLGTYLVTHGLMTPKEGRVRFRGQQGMWVRRPGVVEIEVESSGKGVQAVKIVGDAVIVYEAEVQI